MLCSHLQRWTVSVLRTVIYEVSEAINRTCSARSAVSRPVLDWTVTLFCFSWASTVKNTSVSQQRSWIPQQCFGWLTRTPAGCQPGRRPAASESGGPTEPDITSRTEGVHLLSAPLSSHHSVDSLWVCVECVECVCVLITPFASPVATHTHTHTQTNKQKS